MARRHQQRDTVAIALLWAGCLIGCSSDPPVVACSAGQAIMGGTEAEEFLGLTSSEAAAIVHLVIGFSDSPEPADCSGVLIDESTVLSAAHCTSAPDVQDVHVSTAGPSGAAVDLGAASIAQAIAGSDLLVLQLDSAVSPDTAIPLALASEPVRARELLEIAGYGDTRSSQVGALNFAVESAVQVSADTFTVSSEGTSGACAGDSGGPALRRGSHGEVEVVGLLSSGGAGCLSEDQYVSVVGVRDRLPVELRDAGVDPPCPTYGSSGRCYGDLAVYCEHDALRGDDCVKGTCGWSTSDEGYRCLVKGRDPCGGVPELGDCDGSDVVSCSAGAVLRQRCGACGAKCGRLATSGRAGCVAAEGDAAQ